MKSAKLVLGMAMVAALVTACSGGGGMAGDGNGLGDNPLESTNVGSLKAPAFADFPGEAVVYTEGGFKIGVKTKAIDSTWATEAMDKPADPGSHYLMVWVAVTPELADRGAEKININKQFYVRYKSAGSACGTKQSASSSGYCFAWGWPGSELDVLDDAQWREHSWNAQEYTRTDIKRDETRIGQVGFQIEDTVQATEFQLCVPTKEESSNQEKFPCVPIKSPDGSR